MNPKAYNRFRTRLRRLWLISPKRLWIASNALHGRGHWRLAFWLKQLNGFLYHNSLAPGASVSGDLFLGHNGLGVVVNRNVEIGRRVNIWHHVTLAAGRPERGAARLWRAGAGPDSNRAADELVRSRIIIEDGVHIGAAAVVIAPRGRTLTIGRGAKIGAGAVVTEDVPPRTTVVVQPMRMIARVRSGDGPVEDAAEAGSPRDSEAGGTLI